MDTKIENWPIIFFRENKKLINPNPTYQRSSVWTQEQRELLLDSVLRGIDLPKIYLRKIEDSKSKFKYEIVDGKQRIECFWDFFSKKLSVGASLQSFKYDGKEYDITESNYDDLPEEIKLGAIHTYSISVVVVTNAREADVCDLFFRLNNGTPLTPAEVRAANPSKLSANVKDLAKHEFFSKCAISRRRSGHEQVTAQIFVLEEKGGITDLRNETINTIYDIYKDGPPKNLLKTLEQNLDLLNQLFPEGRNAFLKQIPVVNLYLLISYLHKNKVKIDKKNFANFKAWFISSEAARQQDPVHVLATKKAVIDRESIETRFSRLLGDFIGSKDQFGVTTITLDPIRAFSDALKLQIFAKNSGTCQKCSKKVDPNGQSWEADHIKPWTLGGATTLENGQVLCKTCNRRKSYKLW